MNTDFISILGLWICTFPHLSFLENLSYRASAFISTALRPLLGRWTKVTLLLKIIITCFLNISQDSCIPSSWVRKTIQEEIHICNKMMTHPHFPPTVTVLDFVFKYQICKSNTSSVEAVLVTAFNSFQPSHF